jgi:hypothetical protein
MSYKVPNKKGSRVRKPTKSIVDFKMLINFKNKHPEYSSITKTDFNKIIREFNSNIVKTTIDNRDGLRLPERLGLLQILTFPKPKRKFIDFGKSNKDGVVRYHGNWETDNKIGKIVFSNTLNGYSYKNCRFWGLNPSRYFKKEMSEQFKRKWQKYIYVDNKRK